MGEGAGGPFRVKKHVMSLGSPGILAKARRLQLADASFRDMYVIWYSPRCCILHCYFHLKKFQRGLKENYPNVPGNVFFSSSQVLTTLNHSAGFQPQVNEDDLSLLVAKPQDKIHAVMWLDAMLFIIYLHLSGGGPHAS